MITLLVPTLNRADFVIRLLGYYAASGYDHWISIGDSSNYEQAKKITGAIDCLSGKLKIIYTQVPANGERRCTARILAKTTTPYVAFLPDDDFLITSSLNKCAAFLDDNPRYSVALGAAVIFQLNTSGPWGTISSLSEYYLGANEFDTPSQRLLYHLDKGTNTNFGLHRTGEFQKAYFRVSDLPDQGFTELLANSMAAIQGKTKRLDCLYLIRQLHDTRYLLSDYYDWFTSSNWHQGYQIFRSCLTDFLSQNEQITSKEAEEIVKQAFWSYLSNCCVKKFFSRYSIKEKIFISEFACKTARWIKRRLRDTHGLSLFNLLSKRSRYYHDFNLVYTSVTRGTKI